MKKQKRIFIFVLVLLSISFISLASAQRAIQQESIRSRANCNSLSFQQLDEIGNYVLERIYQEKTGFINQALSGGNPQVLRQFHIRIAREFYCAQPSGMREILQGLKNISPPKIAYRINNC